MIYHVIDRVNPDHRPPAYETAFDAQEAAFKRARALIDWQHKKVHVSVVANNGTQLLDIKIRQPGR